VTPLGAQPAIRAMEKAERRFHMASIILCRRVEPSETLPVKIMQRKKGGGQRQNGSEDQVKSKDRGKIFPTQVQSTREKSLLTPLAVLYVLRDERSNLEKRHQTQV